MRLREAVLASSLLLSCNYDHQQVNIPPPMGDTMISWSKSFMVKLTGFAKYVDNDVIQSRYTGSQIARSILTIIQLAQTAHKATTQPHNLTKQPIK